MLGGVRIDVEARVDGVAHRGCGLSLHDCRGLIVLGGCCIVRPHALQEYGSPLIRSKLPRECVRLGGATAPLEGTSRQVVILHPL
eukprot:9384310-Pyramimonas_sp.AAC.1